MNERLQRYKQKMDVAIDKINSLPRKPASSTEIDATLYRVQIAIEATMDIIAMLVKDKGATVSDDYHNIERLQELKIISSTESTELKRLNGLRNAIVHKYNKFEEETVIGHQENIKKKVLTFLQKVEHEINTLFTQHKT
ncbi:MAG TPA: HepT-like ribonuclease domain-containing protein [Candidatus Nanoarchaeia archaeon]|nr:HepT-like ribonuclease domain-containing protein [Candidatus Nanoarchaeia archaeon]